jgi:hypothetical protein
MAAYQDGLKQGLVDEDVLVLRLDHVVSLCAQASHVTVDVDGLFVFQTFQHRINDNESSCTAHSSAVSKT